MYFCSTPLSPTPSPNHDRCGCYLDLNFAFMICNYNFKGDFFSIHFNFDAFFSFARSIDCSLSAAQIFCKFHTTTSKSNVCVCFVNSIIVEQNATLKTTCHIMFVYLEFYIQKRLYIKVARKTCYLSVLLLLLLLLLRILNRVTLSSIDVVNFYLKLLHSIFILIFFSIKKEASNP